ncbi:MAG: nucleotidyltransferase [Gammaproteobacteria bacterium]|nr:nucleotidyltransferase [Gammaproteobacteria bacterium]
MAIDKIRYPEFLERVAREIDIPPHKYRDAVRRYQAVGRWLEDGEYSGCSGEVVIYPQGSFRLGTVVRPVRLGVAAGYDIDLVCELPSTKGVTTPQLIKHSVGDRLKQHDTYSRLLDDEGRRCWTLEYAEEDDIGFHLDVLPAIPDSGLTDTAIAITHKHDWGYDWSASDPRGYAAWFDGKNQAAFVRHAPEQKLAIQRLESHIYARIDDVPDQLVRTPLQRAIQLMKRNRDLHFNRPETVAYAPISIIITTLAAHLYGGEGHAHSALVAIVEALQRHAALVDNRAIDPGLAGLGLIRRLPDGSWYIANPVNSDENFADRWHEDGHARARAFFSWLEALQTDLLNPPTHLDPRRFKEHLARALGGAAVAPHADMLVRPAPEVTPRRRVHISNPAKPWRSG